MDISVESVISLIQNGLKMFDSVSEKKHPLKKVKIHYHLFFDGSLSVWVTNNTHHNISIRFCGIKGNNIDTGNQYFLDPKSKNYNELRKLHVVLPHTASPEIFYSAKRLDDEINKHFNEKLQKKYSDWERLSKPSNTEIAGGLALDNHVYYIDVAFQDEDNRLITKKHIPVMK